MLFLQNDLINLSLPPAAPYVWIFISWNYDKLFNKWLLSFFNCKGVSSKLDTHVCTWKINAVIKSDLHQDINSKVFFNRWKSIDWLCPSMDNETNISISFGKPEMVKKIHFFSYHRLLLKKA